MLLVLQVVCVCLAAVTMGLALAHALELPGKLRLDRDTYVAVQEIYYPGFTVGGGVGEGLGLLATLLLLYLTPAGAPFWWTVAAVVALLANHLAYWLVTHPVNRFWLAERKLGKAGAGFFGFDPLHHARDDAYQRDGWTRARDRWERSHVLRAALGGVALVALTVATAL